MIRLIFPFNLVFSLYLIGVSSVFGLSQGLAATDYTSNMEKLEFSLLTVGRGEAVYALYGHTILRVQDLDKGLDIGYNWGIFDFHNSLFVWNFYKGKLRYQVAATPISELMNHYQFREKRWVIEDRLRLTSQQKSKLIERLKWNELPENIFYDYDQFKDNCATKPRDHLDFAMGGKIKDHFNKAKTNKLYRDYIREGSLLNPWIYLGLDQITNKLLDQTTTPWESMFIPSALRNFLLEMPAVDDQGQVIADQNLLYGANMLIDLKEPAPQADPYLRFILFILFPAIALGTIALKFQGVLKRYTIQALWVVYGLYSGIFGLILTLNHFVSGYPQLKNNFVLLIHWPTDLWLALLGIGLLKRGRHWPLKIYSGLHLVSIVVAGYGWASGSIQQNILGSLATGGLFGFWILIVSVGGRFDESQQS